MPAIDILELIVHDEYGGTNEWHPIVALHKNSTNKPTDNEKILADDTLFSDSFILRG
jgi:hypothetical protein